MHAVEGNSMSGVTVATMIASMSVASIPRLRQRDLRCLNGHVRSGDLGRGDMTGVNADTCQNPLIRGIDHLLEIEVGEQTGRGVTSQRADLRGM